MCPGGNAGGYRGFCWGDMYTDVLTQCWCWQLLKMVNGEICTGILTQCQCWQLWRMVRETVEESCGCHTWVLLAAAAWNSENRSQTGTRMSGCHHVDKCMHNNTKTSSLSHPTSKNDRQNRKLHGNKQAKPAPTMSWVEIIISCKRVSHARSNLRKTWRANKWTCCSSRNGQKKTEKKERLCPCLPSTCIEWGNWNLSPSVFLPSCTLHFSQCNICIDAFHNNESSGNS